MLAPALLAALLTRIVTQSDVFQPRRIAGTTFAQTAQIMKARPLTYRAADGVTLRGFMLPASDANAPYVLLFYGNAEQAPYENDRLAWLARLGYSAVCFDYRGYGYSGGTPDAAEIRDDSVALYDWLVGTLERRHEPAFVYGVSLGTQFAIHVAAQRAVRGLILQSPVASAQEEMDWYAASFMHVPGMLLHLVPDRNVRAIFQGAREAAAVHAPLIVVHGELDALVPVAQGREVFAAAASSEKRFVEVPGAGHGDIRFKDPPAGPAVAQFLRRHSGGD